MKKALVIVNPTAGKMNIKTGLISVVDKLCRADYIPIVMTTAARGEATTLVQQYGEECDLVVCCGGDGTLNETITGLMKLKNRPTIGYIPCGSTNDMANNLKLSKIISKSADIIVDGEPAVHDIGQFGDDKYFTYIASFGAFTKVSYSTKQSVKNILGHFAYVLEGVKEISDIKSYHVKLTFDDKVIDDEFIYLSVSNTTSFAGLFSFPKDKVGLNDGIFELLLIKKPNNILDFNNIVLSLVNGTYKNDKNVFLFHTNNITVEPDENIVWTIDGECSGEVGKVVIDNIPDTIRIMQKKK